MLAASFSSGTPDEPLNGPGSYTIDQRSGQKADEQKGGQLAQDGWGMFHHSHAGREKEKSHVGYQEGAELLNMFRLQNFGEQEQTQQKQSDYACRKGHGDEGRNALGNQADAEDDRRLSHDVQRKSPRMK